MSRGFYPRLVSAAPADRPGASEPSERPRRRRIARRYQERLEGHGEFNVTCSGR